MTTGEWVGVGAVATVLVVGTGAALFLILRAPTAGARVNAPSSVGSPFGAPGPGVRAAQPQRGIGGVGGNVSTLVKMGTPIVAGFFSGGPVGGALGFASAAGLF